MRDELEKLLDDDDDMADLYLSRKSAARTSSSPVTSSFLSSPTLGSKIYRAASSATMATFHVDDENSVEDLEMLLEVILIVSQLYSQMSNTHIQIKTTVGKVIHLHAFFACRLTSCKLMEHSIN